MDLGTYNVNDFKYTENKSEIPVLEEQLNITATSYATVTGKRVFIIPNILSREGRNLIDEDDRTCDFVFNTEYKDEDIVEIEIPQGYLPEAKPDDITIKSKIGTYTISSKMDGNKIIYHRIREQYSGRFPAKDQQEIDKYYGDIYKADRSRFVLVKKDN